MFPEVSLHPSLPRLPNERQGPVQELYAMTTKTQKKISTSRRAKDEAAHRHFDLSGDWPIIRGTEWGDGRYLDDDPYKTLSPEEYSRLMAWLIANDREIRLTIVHGEDRFMHYPVRGIVEINTLPLDRTELCIDSDSVRHADEISIVVLNVRDQTEAEEMFLQWLEDVTKHLAERRAASRLTA